MAKLIVAGRKVGPYTVLEQLNRGTKAIAYKARHEDGRAVFLKQYKSPTRAVHWFEGYVRYEQEKRRRIESSRAREYCLAPIDIFECEYGVPTLFQAYEFVERGEDLKAILAKLAGQPDGMTWERRLVYARVFLAALESIAQLKIVHGDLKPENIHLIENREIAAGFRPRLIDMDASLLTDLRAPWHGEEGYMGTPNYFSPEHGTLPLPASDVFTAALILHELLCSIRPYPEYESSAEIAHLTRRMPAGTPLLRGSLGDHRADERLKSVLRGCLNPEPSGRPSLDDLRTALLGKGLPPAETPTPAPKAVPVTLRLRSGAKDLEFNLRTNFDRELARSLVPEAIFLSGTYLVLLRVDGRWHAEPWSNPPKHPVTINGASLTARRRLEAGDVLTITPPGGRGPVFQTKVEFA